MLLMPRRAMPLPLDAATLPLRCHGDAADAAATLFSPLPRDADADSAASTRLMPPMFCADAAVMIYGLPPTGIIDAGAPLVVTPPLLF